VTATTPGGLRSQFTDARGGRVAFFSHCLLNQNVRYLGGAGRVGGVDEIVDGYLRRGIGICQLPCPKQRARRGVLKRRILLAYGSAGTPRAPAARLLLRPFLWYIRMSTPGSPAPSPATWPTIAAAA
jgi:hypothetical protein